MWGVGVLGVDNLLRVICKELFPALWWRPLQSLKDIISEAGGRGGVRAIAHL